MKLLIDMNSTSNHRASKMLCIQMAYDRVLEALAEFKEAKNTKLAFRYALLRNYFEDRLPIWSDLINRGETKGKSESLKEAETDLQTVEIEQGKRDKSGSNSSKLQNIKAQE
ncbi:MAG: hypothetical protein ACLQBD_14560 [Syntrophobacteraceae bacterium]